MVVVESEYVRRDLADAPLVTQAQAGNVQAFAGLYERYHARILGHCRSRLGNGDDAADAAQETFLRAWRAIDGFGGDRRFYPWLRTIASNVCVDALRMRNRTVPVAELDVTPTEDGEEVVVDTGSVSEALARLSDRHREILWMREFEGWTYERIAHDQQLDLSAVKSLLWRARQSLRREFLLLNAAETRLLAIGGLLPFRMLHRFATRPRAFAMRMADTVGQLGQAGQATVVGGATAAAVATTVVVPNLMLGPPAPPPPPVTPPAVVQMVAMPAPPSGVHRVVRRAASSTTVELASAEATTVTTEESATTTVAEEPSTTTTTGVGASKHGRGHGPKWASPSTEESTTVTTIAKEPRGRQRATTTTTPETTVVPSEQLRRGKKDDTVVASTPAVPKATKRGKGHASTTTTTTSVPTDPDDVAERVRGNQHK